MGLWRAMAFVGLAFVGALSPGAMGLRAEPKVEWSDKSVIGGETSRFQVLAMAYPNHLKAKSPPVSTHDLAVRLSHDMDVLWFGADPAMAHFAVTETESFDEDGEVWSGFDFGPAVDDSDEIEPRWQVVIRQTAGGGFMLLVERTALEYSARLKTLFQAVVDDAERANPMLPPPGPN